MDKPLVTVITPVYNCEKFIRETVESVLSQDYQNIQYLMINDGSTDGTKAYLETLLDARLEVVTIDNGGEQKAVNFGLQRVEGDFFMIVNADDPLLPGAISTLVSHAKNYPDYLCYYPDWKVIDENSQTRHEVKTREYDFEWMVKHHTCIPSVGCLFQSKVINLVGYRDISFKWLGDFDYWLRIGLVGDMKRVPKTLATWRSREGQASKDRSDARALEHVEVVRKFFRLWRNRDDGKYYEIDDNFLNKLSLENYNNYLNFPVVAWSAPRRNKNEVMCWAHLVAASVAKSKKVVFKNLLVAIRVYPKILINPQCWDIAVKRLIDHWLKGGNSQTIKLSVFELVAYGLASGMIVMGIDEYENVINPGNSILPDLPSAIILCLVGFILISLVVFKGLKRSVNEKTK